MNQMDSMGYLAIDYDSAAWRLLAEAQRRHSMLPLARAWPEDLTSRVEPRVFAEPTLLRVAVAAVTK